MLWKPAVQDPKTFRNRTQLPTPGDCITGHSDAFLWPDAFTASGFNPQKKGRMECRRADWKKLHIKCKLMRFSLSRLQASWGFRKTSKTSSPAGLCLMALDHHRLVSACGHPAGTKTSTINAEMNHNEKTIEHTEDGSRLVSLTCFPVWCHWAQWFHLCWQTDAGCCLKKPKHRSWVYQKEKRSHWC